MESKTYRIFTSRLDIEMSMEISADSIGERDGFVYLWKDKDIVGCFSLVNIIGVAENNLLDPPAQVDTAAG